MARVLVDFLSASKWIRVQKETWGHLRAAPGSHRGYMVFTCGEYGHITAIDSRFDTVVGSPWFYQAQHDFINAQNTERGKIYVFIGEYSRRKGDDCGRFVGKITTVDPEALLIFAPAKPKKKGKA